LKSPVRRTVDLLAALCPLLAHAAGDPAEYLFSPEVEQGEREIDSKAGIAWDRDGHSFWGGKLGVEYGFTAWWASEATVNFGRELGESTELLSFEWENRFELLGGEAHPYAIGALLEVERERDRDDGYELRYGPLLQYARGPLQGNLNLLFERRLSADGEQTPTEFGYQWQWRWRRDAAFDWGLQGFGALGRWDRWAASSEQSHILGPVLFASLGEPAVRRGDDDDDGDGGYAGLTELEAGLLFGTGGEAPRVTLRLQAMIPF
jgi:hypothetical protein